MTGRAVFDPKVFNSGLNGVATDTWTWRRAPGPALDVTGDWTLDLGPSKQRVRLTQNGNHVTATYLAGDGHLDGTIEGHVLKLHWDQPKDRLGGTAELAISPSGEEMSGPWHADPKAYKSGSTATGKWTLQRVKKSG
jgi:hypothetical protein